MVKVPGTLTQYLVKMRHFPSPPPPHTSSFPRAVLTLCIQVLFQHNEYCWGKRGTAEIALTFTLDEKLALIRFYWLQKYDM